MAEALVAGGLRVLEVTLRTPAALDAIRATGADPERHDAFIRRACLIDSLAHQTA